MLLLLAACTLSPTGYPEKYAEAYCAWAAQCMDDTARVEGDPSCEDVAKESMETRIADALDADCEWLPDNAAACLDELEGGCDAMPESCAVLFRCADTAVDKEPVLFLYPEEPTALRVHLDHPERITTSDPPYPTRGWEVLATSDGQLATTAGPRTSLFYEIAVPRLGYDPAEGWCSAGAQLMPTMEGALDDLGFLPREIAEFRDFWDAEAPTRDDVTVHLLRSGLPGLRIDPPPDVLLRAHFVIEPGCVARRVPELRRVERAGFHAAEWGVILLGDLEER